MSIKSTTLFTSVPRGVIWSDPTIGSAWPFADPVLSARDASLPRRQDVALP